MNDKKSPMTVVIIAGAVLGLCCVSSFVGAMLFGIATPFALLNSHDDGPAIRPPVVAVAPPSDVVIEGAWTKGARGISDMSDRNAPAWNSPALGQRIVFRGNHTCEMDAVIRTELPNCDTWRFVSRGNCQWNVVGDQLTVTLGPGSQLSKVCGKDFSESALPAMNIKASIRTENEKLFLHIGDTVEEFVREP